MKYGFVIDNRKCIGCHACTTACKSEHQVPVGVNRTWVKQVEKGEFPNTRRLFSVMRCNHCTDAPCVEICPTEALYFRSDGIVDFDKDRCIGCKSCMQACPYDALYIDPENHTAAKCNYCAHRIDVGLEPACVNVCPEHAIISGDMDNPLTEISQLLARQQVKVRKPEKSTKPNLFYIDADDVSLIPSATEKEESYLWSSQSMGVGHFAKAAEKLSYSNNDVVEALMQANGQQTTAGEVAKNGSQKSIDVMLGKGRRAYDVADKGILWGWEVSAYVFTKAIATGVVLVAMLSFFSNWSSTEYMAIGEAVVIGTIFLALTGALLIKDLDRPDRFLYVLLRPHWGSWLVKGGYAIGIFGALMAAVGAMIYFEFGGTILANILLISMTLFAAITAIYTAFLFAQAKGRDFWQSPVLAIHMIGHAFMAGAAAFSLTNLWMETDGAWIVFLQNVMWISIGINLFVLFVELYTTHSTDDAKRTVQAILKGRYQFLFWAGVVVFGNIIPLVLLLAAGDNSLILAGSGVLVLIGIYLVNHIWVEAPQRIPLS